MVAHRCSRSKASTFLKIGLSGLKGFNSARRFLQFDATDEREFLDISREGTVRHMASHVTHTGVHDHGFNNINTYGNLRRLMLEGRFEHNQRELDFYELAIKASGAVQANRWSSTADGDGYIYSFNGPHSRFSRHDSFLPSIGSRSSTRPHLVERKRLADQLARSSHSACSYDGAIQRVLRRGSRHVRCEWSCRA